MDKINRNKRNEKILELLKTKSQKDVAIEFGLSQTGIGLISKKHNIKLPKSRLNMSKIELDINFFKEIDSPIKAYWIGYICADGGISKTNGKLSLISKDKEIIYKFKKDINSGHKISNEYIYMINVHIKNITDI